MKKMLLGGLLLAPLVLLNSACSADSADSVAGDSPASDSQAAAEAAILTVHKSPTCGCCGAWVDHVKAAGFNTEVNDANEMNKVKQDLGIEPRYQSCHTAVTADGYFFEGHIPAPVITEFLKKKPDGAAGLAVPGMPLGSPGMEMGNRFDQYQVYQINKDGSVEVYTSISSPQQQY